MRKCIFLLPLFLLGACEERLPKEIIFAEGQLVTIDNQWDGLLYTVCYTDRNKCTVRTLHSESSYIIEVERIKVKEQDK